MSSVCVGGIFCNKASAGMQGGEKISRQNLRQFGS